MRNSAGNSPPRVARRNSLTLMAYGDCIEPTDFAEPCMPKEARRDPGSPQLSSEDLIREMRAGLANASKGEWTVSRMDNGYGYAVDADRSLIIRNTAAWLAAEIREDPDAP